MIITENERGTETAEMFHSPMTAAEMIVRD